MTMNDESAIQTSIKSCERRIVSSESEEPLLAIHETLEVEVGTIDVLSVMATASLWTSWVRIALRAEDEAWRARSELERQKTMGELFSALSDETEAALMAIAGSAFAIDGLYGVLGKWIEIDPQIRSRWSKNRVGRSKIIVETLKSGLSLGSRASSWGRSIPELFDLRDGTVHSAAEFRELETHPVVGSVPHERLTYSPENATLAVDLMFDVLSVCAVAHLKAKARHNLVDWCINNARVIGGLRTQREQLTAGRAANAT
jgi:hypothetical protein